MCIYKGRLQKLTEKRQWHKLSIKAVSFTVIQECVYVKLGLKPCFSINERRRTRADARTAGAHFIFDFCLTLMHLLGANFCMTYLFPFSKLRLNANPVLVYFLFWFPGAGRALIFGQHGHLDNFREVNKYFKQRGLRPRQTRNTVNNVTAFPCFFFFLGLFCFVLLSHPNLS